MNSRKPPRWQDTFGQFGRTLALLEEALDLAAVRELSELEKGGLIKRFENAWELGWKTLADFLIEREDPQLSRSPGSAVRLARAAGLIEDSDAWLNAGKLRNVLAHEYSLEDRDEGMILIRHRFLPLLQDLRERMSSY